MKTPSLLPVVGMIEMLRVQESFLKENLLRYGQCFKLPQICITKGFAIAKYVLYLFSL